MYVKDREFCFALEQFERPMFKLLESSGFLFFTRDGSDTSYNKGPTLLNLRIYEKFLMAIYMTFI